MQLAPRKKYLIEMRTKLMLQAFKEGYSKADIAFIFNMERSWVTRILNEIVRSTKK
jgi:DNA invertase Pin-like site-specific DNA recombinase